MAEAAVLTVGPGSGCCRVVEAVFVFLMVLEMVVGSGNFVVVPVGGWCALQWDLRRCRDGADHVLVWKWSLWRIGLG